MAQISGSTTVGTSAVQLTVYSRPVTRVVRLKAAPGNAGVVYVGLDSLVTAGTDPGLDGWPLFAGQEIDITAAAINSTDDIWLIASQAGQKIYWLHGELPDDSSWGWAADFSIPQNSGLMPVLT